MKKLWLVAGISLLTLGAMQPVSVFAKDAATHEEHADDHHDDHDHEEGTEHYKAVEIKSVDHAKTVLNEKAAAIGKVLETEGELEFLQLEEIHEVTYSLEAAIDKIRDEKAMDVTKVESIDEAIQAIHFASENQEEAIVREWFPKLQSAIAAKEAPADAKPVKKEFYTIVIKDHKFSPAEITVPAGEKIKLIVDNQDPTPEEFESHDMNREKIIRGNKKATIYVGPLKPGKYHYFGEFNMETANGYIIAK